MEVCVVDKDHLAPMELEVAYGVANLYQEFVALREAIGEAMTRREREVAIAYHREHGDRRCPMSRYTMHPVDAADDYERRTVVVRQMHDILRNLAAAYQDNQKSQREREGPESWLDNLPGGFWVSMSDWYADVPPGAQLLLYMLADLERAGDELVERIREWHEAQRAGASASRG